MSILTTGNAYHGQQLVGGGSGTAASCDHPTQHSLAPRRELGSGFVRPPPLLLGDLPDFSESTTHSALASQRHVSGFGTPALLQLVSEAAAPAAESTAAPSPGAGSLCSPAQRCLFRLSKPSGALQLSSTGSSSSSIAQGATPDAVDRVAVQRWLQTMEAPHTPCSPEREGTGKVELPPPAFVVLQLLG